MLDWDKNVDPEFMTTNYRRPAPVADTAAMEDQGFRENWITYGTGHYSAKELTVFPKRKATIADAAAYGLIVTQGWGEFGLLEVETPSMIRYGELTKDELFVTAEAARAGVVIENRSDKENLVMLKHFGPGNPDAARLIRGEASSGR